MVRTTEDEGGTGKPPIDKDATRAVEPSESISDLGAHVVRLQLLFDNMLEGYAYCRMLFDAQGQPDDFIYVDVNRAFGELTGLSDVVGRRITEVIPGIKESNPEVLATYGRVVRTGVPEKLEITIDQLGIVVDVSVFRPEPDHFVAVFENITERKRTEQKLDELIRFLEIRLEQRTSDLAEALRIAERYPRQSEESAP